MNKGITIFLLLLLCCRNTDNRETIDTVDQDLSDGHMDAITEVALDSIYNHAYAVLHGDVEDPDYESVKARLEICANAQDARCATLLGYHLIKGFKLKRDVQSGVRYLNEAARLNNVEAMLYLSDYYYESGRVDSSLVLLEKAHENESAEATYVLSEIYLKESTSD